MEHVVIHKRDSDLVLSQYEGIEIKDMTRERQIMAKDSISIRLNAKQPLDLELGNYIVYKGIKYTMNVLPHINKVSSRFYEYNIAFEGAIYDLSSLLLFNTQNTGWVDGGEFSFNGTLDEFIRLIVQNTSRPINDISNSTVVRPTWRAEEMPLTESKLIQFSQDTLLTALKKVSEAFEVEFDVVIESENERLIKLLLPIEDQTSVFSYGEGNGLYGLERSNKQNINPVTRLFVYGSSQNLPELYTDDFRSMRLLPLGEPKPYVNEEMESAMNLINERVLILNDIKPEREGVVTGISPERNEFRDNGLDIDLNATDGSGNTIYLIPGKSAKIHFNSGNLSGRQFEIISYNHATKNFVLQTITDERGLTFPSPDHEAFQIQPGDKYVILDIKLPESYVTSAEHKLHEKGLEAFEKLNAQEVVYKLRIDEIYLKENQIDLRLGNYIRVLDADLGINVLNRIKGITERIISNGSIQPFNIDVDIEAPIKLPEFIEPTPNVEMLLKVNDFGEFGDIILGNSFDFSTYPSSPTIYTTFTGESTYRFRMEYWKDGVLLHKTLPEGWDYYGNWHHIAQHGQQNGFRFVVPESGTYLIKGFVQTPNEVIELEKEITFKLGYAEGDAPSAGDVEYFTWSNPEMEWINQGTPSDPWFFFVPTFANQKLMLRAVQNLNSYAWTITSGDGQETNLTGREITIGLAGTFSQMTVYNSGVYGVKLTDGNAETITRFKLTIG